MARNNLFPLRLSRGAVHFFGNSLGNAAAGRINKNTREEVLGLIEKERKHVKLCPLPFFFCIFVVFHTILLR